VVVSSLFFFSRLQLKNSSLEIEKNVAFFLPANELKIGHQTRVLFCAPPLGLLFRSYLLAFAFFYSLVLLFSRVFDRLFLRAALGKRERERKRETAFVG
jgi:hypothetical protein